MPQGNLETLVSACAGGSTDNKIVCETLATTDDGEDLSKTTEKLVEEEIPPDFPPESFWLSKDAELDWFDRNAFYERKESQKGNSASNSTNLNPNLNNNNNSNSQRFSLRKSKASIIGLPKPQKSCFVDSKNRKNCKPGNTRLFPKRSGSVKSNPSVIEPSSPKVSCMGRVRSRRDRNRQFKKNCQKPIEVQAVKEKTLTRSKRNGFFSSFRAIFRSSGRGREPHDLQSSPSPPRNSDIRSRLPPDDHDALLTQPVITGTEPVVEPMGLGGMKRFASGRRSETLI